MAYTAADPPFQPGREYRVLVDIVTAQDVLLAGTILRFERAAYSAYDEMTGYFFTDADGRWHRWDRPGHELDVEPGTLFAEA